MANAIIDAITWDPQQPIISAQNLIEQLSLLQADWDDKLQNIIQVNTDDDISLLAIIAEADLRGVPHPYENTLFRWFDMQDQAIVNTYASFYNTIAPLEGAATPGKSERLYLFEGQVSGIPEVTGDGSSLYDVTKVLPHDARVLVHYPLMISGGASGGPTYSYMWFEPKLDGAEVLGVAASAGDQPLCAPFRAVDSVNFPYYVYFAYPDIIPAGSHDFTCDVHLDAAVAKIPALAVTTANFGPPIHRDAPDYNTVPPGNVDSHYEPIQGYLEFIYL